MKILLKCSTSNENLCGYDYAVVDLTPTLAREILKKIDLALSIPADARPYEMRFHEISVQWLTDDWSDGDEDEGFPALAQQLWVCNQTGEGNTAYIEIPDDVEISEEWHASSRADDLVIRNIGVAGDLEFTAHWVCTPKYDDDTHCETARLDINTLRTAASASLTGAELNA